LDKLGSTLIIAGNDDSLTVAKVRYAMNILQNEVTKMIILAVLFTFLGYRDEFFFAVALLLPLRAFSGGMHMSSNVGCIIFSASFFLLAIIVFPLIAVPKILMFSLTGIAIVLIAVLSPVVSIKRPLKTTSRRTVLKRMTLIVLMAVSLVLAILWVFRIHDCFVIGSWVVTLQASQLVITWGFRKLKGGRNGKGNQGEEPATERGADA
jgi:accessory gene regulator B